MRLSFLLLVISLTGAAAQEQSGETFKSGVTMIQVPVVVRDHEGRVVSDLVKEDFQLFDNGKRVEIASFSVEMPGNAAPPDRSLPDLNASAAQSAAGTPMDIPARFIAYFFDDVLIRDPGDLTRIRDAAARQLGALQPGDRAGIVTSSCSVMLDFTNDRSKLQETVSRLRIAPPPMCPVSRAQTLQVEVLTHLVRRMSSLPAGREIILISSGFFVGHDRSQGPVDLIEAAIRAKVTIHSVDLGESTDRTGISGADSVNERGNFGSRNANSANPLVLVDLARGTGGTYLTGNNFGESFRRLSTPEVHYVLSFVPTAKADGRAHQLKVKLENGHKLTVEARSEYYAPQRPQ